MLTRNINTAEGLVNGATRIVTDIKFSTSEIRFPSVICVKFNNTSIGKVVCKGDNTIHSSISIYPRQHTFLNAGRYIVRKQFPRILAWACTIHKVQGISLDKAVIDIGSTVFDYGMAYVALSRVRILSGLVLSRLDPFKIRASDVVLEEYERLRKLNRKNENYN